MTLPDFLVVGSMRSGTTWLSRCLAEHPEVFHSDPKEVHYFDRPDRGLDWYERHFRDAGTARAIGESTPVYQYFPEAVDRIAETLPPSTRLVSILRNPVDRAYSHYWWSVGREDETLDFAAALAAEPERLASNPASRYEHSYVDRGRYATQLRHVRERLPEAPLHVMVFEEFRADPAAGFDELCRFLGVSEGFRPKSLSKQVNAHYAFRSSRLRRLTRSLPSTGPARALRYGLFTVNKRSVTSPPMDPAIRARLVELFRPEVEALEALLERDLRIWEP